MIVVEGVMYPSRESGEFEVIWTSDYVVADRFPDSAVYIKEGQGTICPHIKLAGSGKPLVEYKNILITPPCMDLETIHIKARSSDVSIPT